MDRNTGSRNIEDELGAEGAVFIFVLACFMFFGVVLISQANSKNDNLPVGLGIIVVSIIIILPGFIPSILKNLKKNSGPSANVNTSETSAEHRMESEVNTNEQVANTDIINGVSAGWR